MLVWDAKTNIKTLYPFIFTKTVYNTDSQKKYVVKMGRISTG